LLLQSTLRLLDGQRSFRGRAVTGNRGEERVRARFQVKREDLRAKYLGEIERGWHAPTMPTAKRIADALETKLSELFKGL